MITKESLDKSEKILAEVKKYIAGGVVSLNRKVDPAIIFKQGKGSKIYDINGREYIDYHGAFAPHLLGHNYDTVNNAVIEIIRDQIFLIGSSTYFLYKNSLLVLIRAFVAFHQHNSTK